MQKIKLTKKVIIELFVIAGLFLVLLFFAVSQKVAIGQKYQQVYFNGELVGNVANHVSVDDAVHEVRRELAAESDEPLCMDYEYSSSKANHWFTSLMTEDALKEALKEKMKVSEIETQVRAYTVAIEGYRGNFKSMDEVTEFLNTVKNEADTEGQFTTQISKEAYQWYLYSTAYRSGSRREYRGDTGGNACRSGVCRSQWGIYLSDGIRDGKSKG